MRNDEMVKVFDQRFADQKEFFDAKLTHLSAVVQAGFDNASQERQEIIEHQKTTNGRVTALESCENGNNYFRNTLKWKLIGVIIASLVLAFVAHEFGLLEMLKLMR